MERECLIYLNLHKSQLVTLVLKDGRSKIFIFYSLFEDGITGYGMHDEGVDLQFIPLNDIQKIEAIE